MKKPIPSWLYTLAILVAIFAFPAYDAIFPNADIQRKIERTYPGNISIPVFMQKKWLAISGTIDSRSYILIPNSFSDLSVVKVVQFGSGEPEIQRSTFGFFLAVFLFLFLIFILKSISNSNKRDN